jgi:hypothetical protein
MTGLPKCVPVSEGLDGDGCSISTVQSVWHDRDDEFCSAYLLSPRVIKTFDVNTLYGNGNNGSGKQGLRCVSAAVAFRPCEEF